jgi:HSP20 family protein
MATQSLNPYRSRSIEPFQQASPLRSFYRQANRLLEDVFREFGDTPDGVGGLLAPHIDVVQNEQETRITAELPGVSQEDVDVSVDNDVLTIRAEKRVERDEDKDVRHVCERAYGTFQRSLRLPQPVDADQVQAHFDRGVLTVTLPRTEQENGRRKIAIESGPRPAPERPSEAKH